MQLKPQDLLLCLKLLANPGPSPSYNKLANDLVMSPSEVHAAARRAQQAQLLGSDGNNLLPIRRNLASFLVHGAPFVFVADRGPLDRGVQTGPGAACLGSAAKALVAPEIPYIWPTANGEIRGESVSPLYASAPGAAANDAGLYRLLAWFDVLRLGNARERAAAAKVLQDSVLEDRSAA